VINQKFFEVVEKLKAYLLSANRHRAIDIEDETDLVDCGLMDSLRLMGVVVLIEEFCGRQIPLEDISIDKLRTISKIKSNFLCNTLNSQNPTGTI
jgi:acyl carrier protein